MRISVLLCAIGIAIVVGLWGGLGHSVQGGMYTLSMHALPPSYNDPVVLTNGNGMTLYYNTQDTAAKSTCTGSCAKIWPPLLSEGKPTKNPAAVSGSKIDGDVTVVKTANGSQVSYNKHLLYTYTGDAKPGEATGGGKGGKWYIATPVLPKW